MSHFSKLTTMIKKPHIAKAICDRLGYTKEHVEKYDNPWRLANESITYHLIGKIIIADMLILVKYCL